MSLRKYDALDQDGKEFSLLLTFVPHEGDLIYDVDRKQGHRIERRTQVSGVPGMGLMVRSLPWEPDAELVEAKAQIDAHIAEHEAKLAAARESEKPA